MDNKNYNHIYIYFLLHLPMSFHIYILQKYFYDLLNVVSQTNVTLKTSLANDRERLRTDIAKLKKAYDER